MDRKILIFGALASIIIAGGVLATFGKQNVNGDIQKEAPLREEIVVRIPTIQGGSPVLVADELGYFKEAGIRIEEVGVLQSGNWLQSVITGDIDFTLGNHADRVIQARAKGIDVKIVIAQTDTRQDMPHMRWFVLKNSTIRTPKDLVGKTVGMAYITGGCPFYNLREYLRKGGVDIKDVNMVVMPDAQQEQALKQGLIDVATIHAPKSGLLINTGEARVLFSDYDTFGERAGNNFATSAKLIKENPEKVKRFVSAVVKAQDWINANHDEADRIMAKRLDIKPEVVKYFDRVHYAEHGLERDERLQLWIDLLEQDGEIKEGQIKPSDVYTNEFNPFYKK